MIDPGDIARKKIFANWYRFGSILVDATYNVLQDGVYDVSSGDVTSDILSSHDIKIVIDKDTLKEAKNESYIDGDFIALFPALYLLGVDVSIRDSVVIDVTTYTIISAISDPAKATYELHLRKK